MLRFVHTADWQIGMRAAHVGAAGEAVRRARLLAAGRVVQVARDAQAKFLLLAGDTFEDHAVDRSVVRQVAETLAEFSGPVFLLPGNHDPLAPGSVWELPVWREHRNLVVLDRTEPLRIDSGWLFPSPARAKHSRDDPTAWMASAPTSGGGFRIGAAHGTVETLTQAEPDYPIALTAAPRAKLDYLALGHWHSTTEFQDRGAPRMAYSGTHETTKFGERESGQVLLVEIDEPGAAPRLERIRTGTLQWRQVSRELRQPGHLAAVRRELERLASRETSLVELRLSGYLFDEDCDHYPIIGRLLREEFLFARDLSGELRDAPSSDAWWQDLPPSPLRAAAARLAQWAERDFAGDRPDGADLETAALALRELHHLTRSEG